MGSVTQAPWKPSDTTGGHRCAHCNGLVFKPLYWSTERQEVYCNPQCSNDREQHLDGWVNNQAIMDSTNSTGLLA